MDKQQYLEFNQLLVDVTALKAENVFLRAEIANLKAEVQHIQSHKADRRGPKRGN